MDGWMVGWMDGWMDGELKMRMLIILLCGECVSRVPAVEGGSMDSTQGRAGVIFSKTVLNQPTPNTPHCLRSSPGGR